MLLPEFAVISELDGSVDTRDISPPFENEEVGVDRCFKDCYELMVSLRGPQ
ncbi:hypothetical protein [Ferrithrix thermotolerans]|uniref:hypothetical protein n=1 Tax=Ferrithrix thermotolerans TaxID=209649 RepID=UPI0015BCB676|nr:hypothetical protein [Ferrithrix thermotolerans]